LLIGVATGRSDVSDDEYTRVKIHGNHAFSLLKVHSLSHDKRFVLVRDPHSCTNFEDKHVTRESLDSLQKVQRAERRSGSCWISWQMFLKYFSSITICRWRADMFDVRADGQFTLDASQPITVYQFHLPAVSQINISLYYHKQDRTQRVLHTQSFLLCDIDHTNGKTGELTANISGTRDGFTSWDGSLRSGNYVLIPFSTSFWSKSEDTSALNYTVVIHASNTLELTPVEEPVTYLSDCLIAAVIKNADRSTKEKDYKYYSTKNGCMAFVAENSSQQYLNVTIDFEQARRFSTSRQAFLTIDSLPPRTRQILFVAEWKPQGNGTSSMNYSYLTELCSQKSETIPRLMEIDIHQPRPISL
ncbi:unnamed protein product, partial [Didymodactylos carnosus]